MSYATTLRGMTAQEAAEQAMPQSTISSTAGFTQAVFNDIVAAAQSGNFSAFNPSGCSGISPSGASIVKTGSGLALAGISAGSSIAMAAGAIGAIAGAGITAGASVLVSLFISIYQHHAQKVAEEQQVVCASVPAASDSLTAIDQAVMNGTITPAQGIQALQSLQTNFEQTVQPILKMSSGSCNAACVWVKELEAIVIMKSSQYQDMETSATAAVTGTSATSSSAALPAATTSGGATATPTATATLVAPTSVAAAETDLNTTFFGIPLWGWLAGAAVAAIVIREF
jgi:hypothetical protein